MVLKRFDHSFAAPIIAKDKTGEAANFKKIILDHLNSRPRSLQTSLGPSSAGNPCDRSLVFSMSGFEGSPDENPWLAGIGTACHFMLAGMFEEENRLAGKQVWLVEHEVPIRPPAIPKGSCDLFNIEKAQVVDFKILGKSTLDDIQKNGPSTVYRTQLHIYGLGFAQLGYQVNSVLLVALPRNANPNLPFLHEAIFWSEPWNMDLAVDAVKRVEALYLRAKELKATSNIKKLQLVPADPSQKNCHYCPLKNNSKACPDAKT